MDYGMDPGDLVPGKQVARVVESRHKQFPKGKVKQSPIHLRMDFDFKKVNFPAGIWFPRLADLLCGES